MLMIKLALAPLRWLRKRFLLAHLVALEHNANVVQAQMLVAPLELARYRAQITDTQREIARLSGGES